MTHAIADTSGLEWVQKYYSKAARCCVCDLPVYTRGAAIVAGSRDPKRNRAVRCCARCWEKASEVAA